MIDDLTRIFETLTSRREDLAKIDIIAFDIFGTLIDHGMKAKPNTLAFAHYLTQKRSAEIAFFSSEPDKGSDALIRNGERLFAMGCGVQLKEAFYNRCAAERKYVLAIDDDTHEAKPALIHIDPNNDVVKKYLAQKAYRHPDLFRR